MLQNEKPVLFGIETVGQGSIGTVELNRPHVLNALNTECYQLIESRLLEWQTDREITAVLISSKTLPDRTPAFCAGGDVKGLVQKTREAGLSVATEFFTREYFVDAFVHMYKKPIIAFCDGITMGGGLGLAAGCTCRIATERTIVAMPELSIGLFPDVGATLFLQRLQKPFGLFMGLTGARLSGADAVRIGLMDGWIESRRLRNLRADILRAPWQSDVEKNRSILRETVARTCETKPDYQIAPNDLAIIEESFSWDTLREIDQRFLKARGLSPWLEETRARYQKGSPLSRAVFFEAWRRHAKLSITEALTREWEMAIHFTKDREFAEGVRAVLIDKDQLPKWTHPDLEHVTEDIINSCFSSGEVKNPLAEKFRQMGW